MDLPQLLAEYRRTTYFVEPPGPGGGGRFGMRIGARDPVFDRLLMDEGISSWAIITACNPGSRELSEVENRSLQAQLERDLLARGLSFWPAVGQPPEGSPWLPEVSACVLAITEEQARAIGQQYGQVAVVTGRVGHVAELVLCAQK